MNIFAKLLFLSLSSLVFLTTPSLVSAVTVNILNSLSTITDQPFDINVSVTGAQAGTNYLRANLYPLGTTKYFGFTFNGSNFYNGSDHLQYFPVTIDASGIWQGVVQAKLDPTSSRYSGPGNYGLKIRRYTPSGSNPLWSNEVVVNVDYQSSPTSQPSASTTNQTNDNQNKSSPTNSPASSSFTILNVPSQLDSDQTFSIGVDLSLPNNPNSTFYLKGAFLKLGGSNYFGLTKVKGAWVKNSSTFSSQYQVTTDSNGIWQGNLDLQVDPADSGFIGSGEYILKVGRYSSSGSGPSWSNEASVDIVGVGSDTTSASSTSNPKTTILSSTQAPYKKPISTSSSASKKTAGFTSNKISPSSLVRIATVAGVASSSSSSSPTRVKSETKPNYLSIILGVGGFILAGAATVIFIRRRSKL